MAGRVPIWVKDLDVLLVLALLFYLFKRQIRGSYHNLLSFMRPIEARDNVHVKLANSNFEDLYLN
jgi:hypothetical protein